MTRAWRPPTDPLAIILVALVCLALKVMFAVVLEMAGGHSLSASGAALLAGAVYLHLGAWSMLQEAIAGRFVHLLAVALAVRPAIVLLITSVVLILLGL